MFKFVTYPLCLTAVLFLSSCNCPFGCCQKDCCCQKESNCKKDCCCEKSQPQAIANPITNTEATKQLVITTKEQFDKDVLQAKMPVIVDFSAEWCGACKASKPTFDAVANQLGSSHIFATIDIDKNEAVAKELEVQGIPTFIFFKEGKEVHRITGAITKKDDFISAIEKAFGK